MNLLTIIIKGGWVMIPLAVSSVLGVIILVERLLTLRHAKTDTDQFMTVMRSILQNRDISRALTLCDKTTGPIATIMQAGLRNHKRSRNEMTEAITDAGKIEIFYLEKYLDVMGTIAAVAPLIGFLGTVTGMIKAFMRIEGLGGNVNASVLAGGIWEALITTAAGLCVGIPTLIAYNYLRARVEHIVFEMESSSSELVALLSDNNVSRH